MQSAVVIGGTGMLVEATRWVMRRAEHATIIGRSQGRLDRLRDADGADRAAFESLDYRDCAELRKVLQRAQAHGPIDLVVAWIHSTAPDAIAVITEEAGSSASGWRFIHVKGSASDLAAIRATVPMPQSCTYRQVMLGYQHDAGRSRWLTDQEISDGVIRAIEQDRDTTVGQLEPWSERP